jgi:hypothetical protein
MSRVAVCKMREVTDPPITTAAVSAMKAACHTTGCHGWCESAA